MIEWILDLLSKEKPYFFHFFLQYKSFLRPENFQEMQFSSVKIYVL